MADLILTFSSTSNQYSRSTIYLGQRSVLKHNFLNTFFLFLSILKYILLLIISTLNSS